MTGETGSDAHAEDDDTCPVCGLPYEHKKTLGPADDREVLRDDLTECKRIRELDPPQRGRETEVWVHAQRPAVSRVVQDNDEDSNGLLRRLAE